MVEGLGLRVLGLGLRVLGFRAFRVVDSGARLRLAWALQSSSILGLVWFCCLGVLEDTSKRCAALESLHRVLGSGFRAPWLSIGV